MNYQLAWLECEKRKLQYDLHLCAQTGNDSEAVRTKLRGINNQLRELKKAVDSK